MFSSFKANTRLIFSTVSKRLENNRISQCSSKYTHVITRDNKISSTDTAIVLLARSDPVFECRTTGQLDAILCVRTRFANAHNSYNMYTLST